MQIAEEALAASRQTIRWSTAERGIVWVEQHPTECEIIDLTVVGAQVSMKVPDILPRRFELEQNGRRWKVRVVWQCAQVVAVEFIRPLAWLRALGLSALLRRPPRPLI
jgi:hypothetical protein